ncbi:hypothetical protein K439DRAFT_1629632 [Ramaria rubella]|nr:hypothetical protein K439DRAFT_1629632 [Ramaria rubella]
MARKLRQYLLGVGLHSLVNGLGSLPVILPRTIKAKKTRNLHRMPLSSFAAAAATTSPLTYNSSLFTLPPSLGPTEHILGFTSPSANLASLHHSSNDTVTLFPFASAQLEASSFGFDAYPITKDTITPSHAVFMDVPHASEWDPDTSLVVPGAPTMHTIPLPLVPSCTMVEDEEVVLLGDGEAPTPRQCLAWGTDELRLGGLDVCVPVALF